MLLNISLSPTMVIKFADSVTNHGRFDLISGHKTRAMTVPLIVEYYTTFMILKLFFTVLYSALSEQHTIEE